ncbi:MAG: ABC transporter permease [Acidimicrobiales bacterium]|jgi:branched-chain amino acid transport system permease protein|nr:ABC transporter permease [Acidimicrobiales bacterium]
MTRVQLRPSQIAALVGGVAFLGVLVWLNWAGNAVTRDGFLVATIAGLSVGSLYAISATGMVVVYTTTGTFNFAHGGIGVFSAFFYWELVENADGLELPNWIGLLVVVLLIAPLIGIVLDVVLMRSLRNAPMVVQLMVTVGLMVFLLTLTGQLWQGDRPRTIQPFWRGSGFDIGDFRVTWHRFMVIAVAALIAALLRVLLFRTRIGVAMRAVVDNRELTALNGARPGLLSSFAWALGASLAAIAGILIAPELNPLDPGNLNNLMLIAAITAAAIGQLKNLPMTVLGGLLIGLLSQHQARWLSFGSDWPFVRDAAAPVLLFIVVLALPQSRLAVGRVSSNLRPIERTTTWWEGAIGAVALILFGRWFARGSLNFGVWDPGEWDQIALNNGIAALVLAMIGLSLIPLTGWAGQINFAPLAFAGFGAFIFLKLAGESGNLLWLPVVGLLCAPLGALVALFAARLSGLYLALLSLAFALVMGKLVLPHPKIFPTIHRFEDPTLFGWAIDNRYDYFVTLLVFLGFGIFALVLLRRSRYGRRWIAMQDSEAAAATVGINTMLTKVVVYAFSATLAGMAGVFWALSKGSVDSGRDFEVLANFEIVLLMAAAGVALPSAALFLAFIPLTQALGGRLDDGGSVPWLVWLLDDFLAKFGPGLLAIGMVVNQRGAIFEMGRGFAPILPWRRDAREEMAQERAAKTTAEIGGLGLDLPFTNETVLTLDTELGIIDEVTPSGGYTHGVGTVPR